MIGRLSFSSAPVSGENLPHEMELSLSANLAAGKVRFGGALPTPLATIGSSPKAGLSVPQLEHVPASCYRGLAM
jgi:hypothetical protein